MNRVQHFTDQLLTQLKDHKQELALKNEHYQALTFYLLVNKTYESGVTFWDFKSFSRENFEHLQDFLQQFYNFVPDPNIDETIRLMVELDVEALYNDLKRVLDK